MYVRYKKGVKNEHKIFSVMAPSGNRYSFYDDRFISVIIERDFEFFKKNSNYEVSNTLEKNVKEIKEKIEEVVKPKKGKK